MARKKAVIFPGQGAQYPGMGKDLFQAFAIAKERFQQANEILGIDISNICFSAGEEVLQNTLYQQLGIFLVSVICWDILKEREDFLPAFAAGLSLGEYTSLYAAGVVDFEKGLLLVKERAEAMEEAARLNPSFMLALMGIGKEDLEKELSLPFFIANLNCPTQVVVSVGEEHRKEAEKFIKGLNLKRVVELKVSGGFHSPFMEPAQQKLAEALAKVSFSPPLFPIVTNVDAQAHQDVEKIKFNLIQQLTHPVLWQKSIEFMASRGVEEYYEVGPSKVLKGLLRRINKELKVFNFSQSSDFKKEAV
ncbi:MAG: ACP S-malonyltransferase [Candidatus Omnitrophica bacterium]|nr:ACP S-malonyltransferase [Candidatus Omnitrophota bacterium]